MLLSSFYTAQIFIKSLFIIGLLIVCLKIIKRYFIRNINVNCWFCSHYTLVPIGNENCWSCPKCDQYNGFKEDGDYNKPIPAQYHEHMNHGISAIKSKLNKGPENHFCDICMEKMSHKVLILNQFEPKIERNFEIEYEKFKADIEQRFPLCHTCSRRVHNQLTAINNQVLPEYLTWSTKYKRQQSNRNRKTYSFLRQINVLPVFIIVSCLLIQIMIFFHPFIHIKNSAVNSAINSYENQINVVNFVIIFLFSTFGYLRPSVRFSNFQFSLHLVVIVYNYLVGLSGFVFINRYEKFFRILPIVWNLAILIGFVRKVLSMIRSTRYKKPLLEIARSPGKSDRHQIEFVQSKINGKNHYNGEFKNDVYARSSSIKPSRLNFVQSGNQFMTINNKSILSVKTEMPNHDDSSISNFDSASQCQSVSMRSVVEDEIDSPQYDGAKSISGRSVTSGFTAFSKVSFRTAPSRSSDTFCSLKSSLSPVTKKPLRFGFNLILSTLLKGFLGAVFGYIVSIGVFLLLSYWDAEVVNYLI